MSRTKILGIVIIAVVVIYLIYTYWKTAQTPKSYPLEEVHEHGNGETTWVCIVKDDETGAKLRPNSEAFKIGDKFKLSNTNYNLDGDYTIKAIWYDSDGNIGCLRIDTPPYYTFNYQYSQGGEPRDGTYFGLGQITKI
jgi:hypothetical protein